MTNHLTDTRYHLSIYCVFNNTLFVRLGVCPLCSQHSKLATGYNLREFNRPQTGMCPFLLHDIILFPRNCSLKLIKHTRLRIPTQDHSEKGANTQTKGHNTPTSYINCSKTQFTQKYEETENTIWLSWKCCLLFCVVSIQTPTGQTFSDMSWHVSDMPKSTKLQGKNKYFQVWICLSCVMRLSCYKELKNAL